MKLTLSCPDPAFARAIDPMVRSWEVRTGATVTLTHDAMTPGDGTDLGVLPVGRLGEWAEPGHLAPVPARFRASEHPFRWAELLPAYAERLVEWGAQTQALPLTGDGFVLVYRADRFADPATATGFEGRWKRPLTPPVTWEQFAEVATFFAERDKGSSLPALPADPDRMFDLFSRVASSFDRPALSDKDLDERTKDPELLAFQFAVRTGAPRLGGGGFRLTAEWLEGLAAARCLPTGGPDDPVAALAEGRAALALVSLDQLARLPREGGAVPARFGLANVPGAHRYFDPVRGAPVESQTTNYVPHFSGGRLGVVRARCPHADLAFDLLAEIGGPARSAELVSTPGLGAGPIRTTHLNPDRLLLWLGYGFDEGRSRTLQDALRHYLADTVKNPTFGLRGPDRDALTAAAAGPLRKLGAGAKAGDALAQVLSAWGALDAKVTDPATLIRWRKRAAGLN